MRLGDRATCSGSSHSESDLISLLPDFEAFGVRDVCLYPLDSLDRKKIWILLVDDTSFEPSMFAKAGIPRPTRIAQSVLCRQAEFFFGRMAAVAALWSCGVYAPEVPIGNSREPVWPVGMVGSITHCKGLAAAVVAYRVECLAIGIDIERIATGESLRALRTTVLDNDEIACLSKYSAEMGDSMSMTLAFSAKESFFKAAFETVGEYFDFEAVKISDVQPSCGRLTLRLAENLAPSLPCGHEVDVVFGWICPDTVITGVSW